jgi:hemoglobin
MRFLAALALTLAVSACAAPPPKAPLSLYERLGGLPAIKVVTRDFVDILIADPRLAPGFAGTDFLRLERLLVEQMCAATGGPCTYTGRDMKTAHAQRPVTTEQFNWTGEDLIAALDKNNVPEAEKTELLDIIVSLAPQIVSKP